MDKMGATNGVGLIVYTGSRDDLQRKLRERDDRIAVLEQTLRAARLYLDDIGDHPEPGDIIETIDAALKE